ncbi:MAG TPA: TonB family protein [Pyrinomonadaceae bacterium]|jgi:TonB family protein|nr:TonB family protein [Pyrinomonadaceae bacterium]
MFNKLSLLSLVVFGSLTFFGQTSTLPSDTATSPKIGGYGDILNGKATSLPKPSYPAAARAANASGVVVVQVTVDEDGNVIRAQAVSGEQLLRQAAEDAARKAKFQATASSGQLVKTNGVLVYNFVSSSPQGVKYSTSGNWMNVGMTLATLGYVPTLRYFQPDAVAHMIPSEWATERQQLNRLGELKKIEMEAVGSDKPKERVLDGHTSAVTVSPDKKSPPESLALGQSLIASIEGRLGGQPLDRWYFDLGIQLNRALDKADSRDKDVRMSVVGPFRDFIATAPSDVPKEISDELQSMYLSMEKGIFTDQDKIAFTKSLMKISSTIGVQ